MSVDFAICTLGTHTHFSVTLPVYVVLFTPKEISVSVSYNKKSNPVVLSFHSCCVVNLVISFCVCCNESFNYLADVVQVSPSETLILTSQKVNVDRISCVSRKASPRAKILVCEGIAGLLELMHQPALEWQQQEMKCKGAFPWQSSTIENLIHQTSLGFLVES